MYQLFKPYDKNETAKLLDAIKHDTSYQTVGKSFLQDVFYFGGILNKDPKKLYMKKDQTFLSQGLMQDFIQIIMYFRQQVK